MIYQNIYTGFILRYIGALETYSQYLVSFITSVLPEGLFLAMIVKVGFTACPKIESV